MILTDLDKEIILRLQEDLPICNRPYLEIARDLNIDEELLINKIRYYLKTGVIRRFGGALKHRELGYAANAMIVWQVENERASEVGNLISQFPEVSHCYQRPIYPQWPYNIFSMVHGKNISNCEEIALRISTAINISNYQLLFSSRELKKTSMKYFCKKKSEIN